VIPAPLDALMNRGPAKKVHDFKKPAQGEPWFTAPLARFIEMIDPFVDGIRTLPNEMLEAEHEVLVALCGQPDHHLAHRLLQRIYSAERSRRADSAREFDADLDAALSRLVRQTTEADRQLVREIGESLFKIGGRKAMTDAAMRMAALPNRPKAGLRSHMLEKRWAGIGGCR